MALTPEDYTPSTRERLRFFGRSNRRPDNPPAVITSSGMEVNFSDETIVASIKRTRQAWQSQVWDAYDVNGEVHNAVNAVADLMSRVVLFVAEAPKDKDAKPTKTADGKVISTFERLGTPVEISTLLHDISMQKLLPGEYNLVGIQPGDGRPHPNEEWIVFSIEELRSEGGVTTITHPYGMPIVLKSGSDTWIRMWTPHPRRRTLADSPLRPLLGNIDELVWWDSVASAVAKNRLAQAGMIGIPSNLELPAEAGEPPNQSGGTRFIRKYYENVTRAVREPGSAAAAVPLLFTYPWNDKGVSGVEPIPLERPQDELLEQRTDRSLRRIAQGFPLPVEAFFGMGDATHWGGKQISQDKFSENVEPFVIDIVNDLTRHWLRPILRKMKVANAEKYLIWYDASALISQPNIAEQSNKGLEYGALSRKAWRRLNTISEADAADEKEQEEILDWMRALRGREGNPSVQEDGDPPPADGSTPREPTNPGDSHPPRVKPSAPLKGKGQPIAASANRNGHSTNGLGRKLAEIDDNLLTRLQVMSTEQTRRALEKAGNKIRNWSRKNPSIRASIRNIPAEDVGRTLGPDTVRSLGEFSSLFEDAYDDVPTLFAQWCDRAVEASIEVADLPSTIVSSASFQMAYSTTDAGTIFVRELKELAADLLFTSPSTDPQPEADDQLVPVSMVRRALARVGGGEKPNLLLATGRTMTKHLAEAGHFANDWEWWYPVSGRHPDKNHQQFDGGRFQIDVFPHQPGEGSEHCRCVAVPVFGT